ncbi:N-terminal domain with HPIH motif-domain-containing protein [Durotheca rogersii]|uniref:N-terminal domain with HPIH motif-domain-containing protein n=1 Tax=Durotheca rogersii TaxID=419775 RepID=UPI00222108B9|nr:N-terminal domain with HPIH motif-domain-containing protein [Durotheca rogersii]KAI5865682.1 N-terminal domain with HPIH motif-domain-containing protein [Durotheca rogersii]
MIASSLLPSRFRGEQPNNAPAPPSKLNQRVTPALQFVSKITCLHPIHTIVLVALIASTTYIGIVKESLLDVSRSANKAD